MNEKIEDITRKDVADMLPHIVEKALLTYCAYMEGTADLGTAKAFKDFHAAGKVAISHLEALLELARWVDAPVMQSGEAVPDLSAMMQSIVQRNAKNPPPDFPEDDGDEVA